MAFHVNLDLSLSRIDSFFQAVNQAFPIYLLLPLYVIHFVVVEVIADIFREVF